MAKDLHLQKFEATSFMGIDSTSPIIIDFTKARRGSNVTLLKGDQGTGKSSTLTALMYLMGATFDFDTKNLINITDEDLDINLEFTHDGEKYQAIAGPSRVTLKKYYAKSDRWVPEGSPKDTLRRIFGNLGVSPMFLKDLSGKKQIQWFKETSGAGDEVTKKENAKIAELKTKEEERKETNREIKSLKGWLDLSPLYNNYEKSQKKFATPINAEKEKAKFEDLADKKTKYEQYINTVATAEASLKDTDKSIADLEERLKTLKAKRVEDAASVDRGKEFLKKENGILKEYEVAQAAWLNLSKDLTEQNTWKEVQKKEKDYNACLEENINQNADIDKLRQDLLKLTKSYLPKSIEGLEVRVKVKLDDEDEGIFYQNKSLAQLSESELWDLFLLIWEEKDVNFIFCENISSLGSQAVDTLNRLVKEKKAQVFASAMDRAKDHLEISFSTKVE